MHSELNYTCASWEWRSCFSQTFLILFRFCPCYLTDIRADQAAQDQDQHQTLEDIRADQAAQDQDQHQTLVDIRADQVAQDQDQHQTLVDIRADQAAQDQDQHQTLAASTKLHHSRPGSTRPRPTSDSGSQYKTTHNQKQTTRKYVYLFTLI